jgi:hypothetical protein
VQTPRLRLGDVTAIAAGVVLIASMFLDWYGARLSVSVFGNSVSVSTGLSAWQAYSVADIALVVLATLAISLALAHSVQVASEPVAGLAAVIVGLAAAAIILYRIAYAPDLGTEFLPQLPAGLNLDMTRRVGIFLGLAASLCIALGGSFMFGPRRR